MSRHPFHIILGYMNCAIKTICGGLSHVPIPAIELWWDNITNKPKGIYILIQFLKNIMSLSTSPLINYSSCLTIMISFYVVNRIEVTSKKLHKIIKLSVWMLVFTIAHHWVGYEQGLQCQQGLLNHPKWYNMGGYVLIQA